MISCNIDPNRVIEAFRILAAVNPSPQSVKQANSFLDSSESVPGFASLLLNIFANCHDAQAELLSLLLLTNVVRRNWPSKRTRSTEFEKEKGFLKTSLLAVYEQTVHKYCKHLNQLFKFLASQDFPVNYRELHTFILTSLTSIAQALTANTPLQQIVNVLSTCKVVLKEFSLRRIIHSEDVFQEYILPIVRMAASLSVTLHHTLLASLNADSATLVSLLDAAKKANKIALYALQSMSTHTFLQEIEAVIIRTIQQASQVNEILTKSALSQPISDALQNYLHGTLEQVGKIQSSFPLHFAAFLQDYLTLILSMLVHHTPTHYTTERLVSTVIVLNTKPFTTFAYYMDESTFQKSIYNRKGVNSEAVKARQQACHSHFKKVFTVSTVINLLSTLLKDVMTSENVLQDYRENIDEMVLEQDTGHQDRFAEATCYQLCVSLCKNMIRCYKEDLRACLFGLIESTAGAPSASQQLKANNLEIIMLLPSTYQESEIPLNSILKLLESLHSSQSYSYLAKIIKQYQSLFAQEHNSQFFSVLSQIVAHPIDSLITPLTIYQCALTMKRMLNQTGAEYLQMHNMQACVRNIVQIMTLPEYQAVPTIIWPLIVLVNSLLAEIPRSLVGDEIGFGIIQSVAGMVSLQTNEELTVCGLAELLQTLLESTGSIFRDDYMECASELAPVMPTLFTTCCQHIGNNLDNPKLENVDNIFRLWLSLIRHYPTLQQQPNYPFPANILHLNEALRQLFKANWGKLIQSDVTAFAKIAEEYLICGLIELTPKEIVSILEEVRASTKEKCLCHVLFGLYSLYFTYSTLNHTFIPEIVTSIARELISMVEHVTPNFNAFRTLLLIIFHEHVFSYSALTIFPLANLACNGYEGWFSAYVWNQQYVLNRLAFKINAAGVLKSINDVSIDTYAQMLSTPINQILPVNTLLKILPLYLVPLEPKEALTHYISIFRKMYSDEKCAKLSTTYTSDVFLRKAKLHLSGVLLEVSKSECRTVFREVFTVMFAKWSWGEESLNQRFSSSVTNSIVSLLCADK